MPLEGLGGQRGDVQGDFGLRERLADVRGQGRTPGTRDPYRTARLGSGRTRRGLRYGDHPGAAALPGLDQIPVGEHAQHLLDGVP